MVGKAKLIPWAVPFQKCHKDDVGKHCWTYGYQPFLLLTITLPGTIYCINGLVLFHGAEQEGWN